MFKLFPILLATALVAGCTTTAIDAALQKNAPQVCVNASTAYQTFVATGRGSAKTQATVNAAYSAVREMCKSPSTITSAQVAVVLGQTYAIIRAIRSVQ